jgi:hypothetical protein
VIFGRKRADSSADTIVSTDGAQSTISEDGVTRGYTPPKDHPTPKRSASEAARKTRVAAPADRKTAMREQREKRRVDSIKVREAMATGNDAFLPARDKGPVRRAIRDFVDARLMFAELLMPLMVVMLLLLISGVPGVRQYITLAWVLLITLVLLDLLLLWARLRRMLRQQFPGVSTRGATSYGILRATQLRLMRLPKPQVRIGGAPKQVRAK